ncbi:hypothetical protein HD553DRAFT_330137 [Filobasidium floriforme]|uniref:uncharacterized protein n=1 Tax=Filobasidium floriforme TaxID=5210 RepID=UPI001E8D94B4|nr:uncharacterized protein HD553DRAFT_330137 [Filobasidium floriforme]KAH8078013.1 hypothetical protein HD553DRAFT_330137 [Filobasidium floriforme]
MAYHNQTQQPGNTITPFTKTPPIPPPPPFCIIACLVLSKTDRLRLMGFPEHVLPELQRTIERGWTRGIQSQGYKLGGRPWAEQGSEAIMAHRLMTSILTTLSLLGWHLYRACDLSKKSFDKDTIFFKHTGPRDRRFFAISFRRSDRLCLVDAPSEDVKQAFRNVVYSWAPGIQNESNPLPGSNTLELKLRGNPWFSSTGIEVLQARSLCCRLLAEMEGRGYSLVGSVDMCAQAANKGSPDLDTWFFGTT